MNHIAAIDISEMDPRLQNVKIEVACDVNNPLVGPTGASAVYGPQKGATPEMVQFLDQNLNHYAEIIKRDLNKDVKEIPGAGAAGGLGAGLLAFLSAELKRGVDIVISATNLEQHIQGASLVITGEGKIDSQTINGKTPIGVAKIAKKYGIPVIGIGGNIAKDSGIVYEHGIDALFSIVPRVTSLQDAMENAEKYVRQTAKNIAAIWNLARK